MFCPKLAILFEKFRVDTLPSVSVSNDPLGLMGFENIHIKLAELFPCFNKLESFGLYLLFFQGLKEWDDAFKEFQFFFKKIGDSIGFLGVVEMLIFFKIDQGASFLSEGF